MIICLWKDGELNSAILSVEGKRELVDILKDWLVEHQHRYISISTEARTYC